MTEPRNAALLSEIRRHLTISDQVHHLVSTLDQKKVEITGLSLEARAALLSSIQELAKRPLVIVVPGEVDSSQLLRALELFHRDPSSVAGFPAPSLSPYQEVAPSLAVVREEVRTLGRLVTRSVDTLVLPVRALFNRLPEPASFASRITTITTGTELDVKELLQKFVENGFVRTDLVGEIGEFAFRGGILDFYPPNADLPVRIELFGDNVESLRHFDAETQRSSDHLASFNIEPVAQFPFDKQSRTALARRLSVDFNDPLYKRDLNDKVERLSEGASFPGLDHYLPIASASVSFPDYLGEDWLVTVFEPDQVRNSIEKYGELLRNEYEIAAGKGKAIYPPEKLLTPPSEISSFLDRAHLAMSELRIEGRDDRQALHIAAPAAEVFVNRLGELAAFLQEEIAAGLNPILFIATRGGREKIERLLREFSVPYRDEGDTPAPVLTVTNGALARGFRFREAGLSILSEWDLFDPPTSGSSTVSRKKATQAFLTDLRDLKVGDYIVHVDHGVARFKGLQRIPFGETDREVMELEYHDGGKLLLPMESLNLIQKYSGGAETPPRLDKLGGTSWARTKASVKKAMRDMADELLKLYATRQMVKGHRFSKDSPWQFEFEESFEFDETDDQLSAIEDLKSDMESHKPMDRLLCGDVGYGKTEVAMRAAFKAVMDGKQVAFLAPTTILAYQHHRTFMRRFASFPVSIALLSRYYSAKEQKELVAKLGSGEIDIVIGTHRVLSKDLQFKDLGLVVIDEEQRFGVGQKEKLKQLKKAVDVLSMSATPIPRTLHMSLVGIRDISVIETPPKDRLAIQTAVVPYNFEFIREAIEFELGRGGQIFFVHNRVESIYAMKESLEKIVPGLRVIVGHGQMDERELEKAMGAFIAREFDVLLATTIIENGIDIPACNTILINHAERFGLSQLYQLRGRVGRSDRLAFCYLLVPSDKILSSDARKRLAAIQEFSDLGAGFRIAARDLEIRGGGNILGGEQSGQIAAVGFEMYVKLLDEAVKEMKGEKVEEAVDTSMNLGVDIYIPRDYMDEESLRMTFYKKIASAADAQRLEVIRSEMRDRFGALPPSVENLIAFVQLKQLAQSIGVLSAVREGQRVVLKLRPDSRIDPARLLTLLNEQEGARFSPAGALSLPLASAGGEVIAEIGMILTSLAA
ncbi:MAG TPA: transcription-repair coupling factor [Thermoanaerobaculia bacterium]|nr:transcription-repair coupling factor [Thermoanaerobaculia bacterium]